MCVGNVLRRSNDRFDWQISTLHVSFKLNMSMVMHNWKNIYVYTFAIHLSINLKILTILFKLIEYLHFCNKIWRNFSKQSMYICIIRNLHKFLIKRLSSEKFREKSRRVSRKREWSRDASRKVEKEKTARNYAVLHCFFFLQLTINAWRARSAYNDRGARRRPVKNFGIHQPCSIAHRGESARRRWER